ncbi:MAG: M23 family metallopeptidase [Candidatus Aminicenantes bacterium]|nr:M23 family metallopeptidase [Candidatus Aminicenantes bacterium]
MRRSILRTAAIAAAFLAAAFAGLIPAQERASSAAVQTLAPAEAPFVLSFRSLQPGEAILARLKDDAAVKRVTLTLGDQVRVLEPATDSAGTPLALLGIDLGRKAQPMALKVKIERADGTTAFQEIPLVVASKEFPSTNLQVSSTMTTPPKALLETIRRESELVAEVLGRVSPDWLAEGPFQSPLPAFEPFPNFGQQRLYNKVLGSVHSGIDIAAPRGTKAAAPNSGRVVLANRLYYSGWTVIIDHGRGVFTYCCHFDRLLVKRGDAVRKGQAIAEVGSTGRSTGPHLHWSVRILSARVDPFSLVALPL